MRNGTIVARSARIVRGADYESLPQWSINLKIKKQRGMSIWNWFSCAQTLWKFVVGANIGILERQDC